LGLDALVEVVVSREHSHYPGLFLPTSLLVSCFVDYQSLLIYSTDS
jgi:hypothetical protein